MRLKWLEQRIAHWSHFYWTLPLPCSEAAFPASAYVDGRAITVPDDRPLRRRTKPKAALAILTNKLKTQPSHARRVKRVTTHLWGYAPQRLHNRPTWPLRHRENPDTPPSFVGKAVRSLRTEATSACERCTSRVLCTYRGDAFYVRPAEVYPF